MKPTAPTLSMAARPVDAHDPRRAPFDDATYLARESLSGPVCAWFPLRRALLVAKCIDAIFEAGLLALGVRGVRGRFSVTVIEDGEGGGLMTVLAEGGR